MSWNFQDSTTTRFSQEMESIKCEIAALRTQTSMAMVRSQSQPLIKDSELPALSNPSRVKKLTKFFGTEPPLIRLFLRELGYEVRLPTFLHYTFIEKKKFSSYRYMWKYIEKFHLKNLKRALRKRLTKINVAFVHDDRVQFKIPEICFCL